ncbi:YggS family pyridoxal phosphate enzyme [Devosia yakushimensis]|uniref:Pyridoxal phosphate homeostasis protein n=1 Tax=Devosia yakushimensis TaxID=470028 RepID=A0ABQ5UKE5_9HYPH|nr:YggS family pyridoxal phosphate-dependent enzyme [Devosia yakushimensis]GLQ12104.1 YggS family pyridoxal phosphate enzyme [Devosia yakushimensis]
MQNDDALAEEVQRFGPDPLSLLSRRINTVDDKIVFACQRSARPRNSVRMLIISKTVPSSILRRLYHAGYTEFGENKVQEALEKREELADLRVTWQMVGHLQKNKAKYIARFASEFHALDDLSLAAELQRRLDIEDRFLDIFVQVNTSGEASKYGLPPDRVPEFVRSLPEFPRLRPRGLMTLALHDTDMSKVRPCFRLLRELRDATAVIDPRVVELSMGMSGDFDVAIEEGATTIRIGQAIFGQRPTPDGFYWPREPNR